MYCKYCGKQIRDDSTFCDECGNQLEPKKKKRTGIVLAVIFVVVALAIAASVIIIAVFPAIKYAKAVSLRDDNKFEEANTLFEELGNYKNSKTLIHHYYEIIDSKEATCEEDGYQTFKCTDCGDTYTKVIYGEHSYSLATCTEPKKCTKCGKIAEPAHGHFTEWAFCFSCGEKLYETKKYSGKGVGNIKNVTLPIGTYNITFTHNGSSNFAVYFNNSLIVNQIGETSYVYQMNSNGIDNGYFNIYYADGSWTVTIEAIK